MIHSTLSGQTGTWLLAILIWVAVLVVLSACAGYVSRGAYGVAAR